MKHLSLNTKLQFPSFDITLNVCKNNCEYGLKSRLCYALNNPRIMVYNMKKLQNNEKLLNSKSFVSVIKKEILLSNFRKIRLFSYGDIYKIDHLEKIIELSKQLPQIKFWLSTLNDNILFQHYKDRINDLPNLNILLSNVIPNSDYPKFLIDWCNNHNICMSKTTNKKSLSNCHASMDKSNCGLCENCFNGMNIIYYLHGKHALTRLKKYEGLEK